MTGTAIGTAIGQEQRDEAIAEALTAGRSLRAVRREFGISTTELDAALDRLWPIDTAARLRTIKTDLGQLNQLTQVFYEKALAGDVPAGTVTVKLWERKHQLLGLDAVQRIDLQIINPPKVPPRHELIREAIERLTGRQLPNDGNGRPLDNDSAVDALADTDHPKHK